MSDWRALSLTRPWPYTIVELGKRIENRQDRRGKPPMCSYRGPLLLHAAKSWDATVAQRLHEAGLAPSPTAEILSHNENHPAMAIIGRCVVVGHVEPRPAADVAPLARTALDVVPYLVVGNPDSRTSELPGVHTRGTRTRWDRVIAAADDVGLAYAQALDLRWWMGGYALLLAEVAKLAPIPCRGAQGLWRPPSVVLEQLEAA